MDVLTELQPDYVKIDRSHISNCCYDTSKQAFIQAVMKRAKSLGIYVLAEGIETKDEWDLLQDIGVDFGQGYYLGKPAPQPQRELFVT
ncbi:EAL domain-containing protein [Thalassobacillus sp. CUG 92003]|uniref:EAL domain-containing protein n=1 Tax=Thalassobacillus sp. CUG 92003 TaxID=2736641 RepID=UPI00351AA848